MTNAIRVVLLATVGLAWTVQQAETVGCDPDPCHNGGSCSEDDEGNFQCICYGEYDGITCRKQYESTHSGTTYWYLSGDGTWFESLQACYMYGGTLAVFPDQITEMSVRFLSVGSVPGFIGLSSGVAEGIWRWTDTSTTLAYTNFESCCPDDPNLDYVYSQGNSWETVSRADIRTGTWCMERDPSITCDDTSKGCLQLRDTFEALALADNVGLALKVINESECVASCLYSVGFACSWYHYENETCNLGETPPTITGTYSVHLRKVTDTSIGRCLAISGPEDTYDGWTSGSCKLAAIDSKEMYEKLLPLLGVEHQAFIGLYSESKSNWRFLSGASPTYTKWGSTSYPTGGSAQCVILMSNGNYQTSNCDEYYLAACEFPAQSFKCNNAPNVASAAKETVLEYNIRQVRYTCAADYDVFEGVTPFTRTIALVCPCDGVWVGVTVPECVDFDDCHSDPCENGGTCMDDIGTFKCSCVAGFTGTLCETDIDECASEPCQNGASCNNEIDSYSCNCALGYNGYDCDNNINECASTPCRFADAVCMDYVNRFECHCPGGYQGTTCEIDIDECDSAPCKNDGTCVDGANRYTCECSTEYKGIECETIIDHCELSPCWNDGVCIDAEGGFECSCPEGFEGDKCEVNIDECASSPCDNGQCVDKGGGYNCICSSGYKGALCETVIEECISSPCTNGARCTDRVDGYECLCADGYEGDSCQTDVNECESSPCANGGACEDQVNGFSCDCADGYEGPKCESDVNDCWPSQPCQNGGKCSDKLNGFECECMEGFEGTTCETDTRNVCKNEPCQNGGVCNNEKGSYVCDCAQGYSGTNCEVDDSASASDDFGAVSGVESAQAQSPQAQKGAGGGSADTAFFTQTTLIGMITALAIGIFVTFLALTYVRRNRKKSKRLESHEADGAIPEETENLDPEK